MSKKSIIVDLDGTLANIEHRVKYIEQAPKNWEAFHATMEKDQVVSHICYLVLLYARVGHPIVYITGRNGTPENIKKTIDWINAIPELGTIPYTLHMRKPRDWRADTIVKLELAKKNNLTADKVELCLDDRSTVVDMWRANGYMCLQVAEGNF